MRLLKPLVISGKEVVPLVEGGKGIAVSNGESSGAWAATGGVGTFSGVNADSYDENGNLIPFVYREKRVAKGMKSFLLMRYREELRKRVLLMICRGVLGAFI